LGMLTRTLLAVVAAVLFSGVPSCGKAYYRTMEFFGQEKRDIMTSRVKDAQKAQEEAKEQFASALDRFSALVNAPNSDLRKAYDRAKADLDRSESRAKRVHDRVDSVESVGRDLFREWEAELKEYKSDELRNRSRRQLQETRQRFDQMLASMRRVEASMDPVLDTFRDTVLMLKHTLNAEAVASLRSTVAELDRDVKALIRDMERSIEESNRFISEMSLEPQADVSK
jgi:hypothetical protein